MRCAAHPETETNLKCGKCGQPICPKCMVQTPVGARCPDCAKLYKLPTYRVPAMYYLRAAGTALGVAIAGGIIWGLINGLMPFFYLSLILAGGVGYAIGELVSRSVNRKSSRGLATIGGVAVVISYLINILFSLHVLHFGGFPSSPLRIIIDLVAIGVGIYIAVSRLR
jgi:hypothetical protein